MLRKSKGFAHLFLLVVIVIVGIGGILYYSWQKGLIRITPSQEVSPTPTPDPTTDWKTYKNAKYGYTIKYPPDYRIEIKNQDLVILYPPQHPQSKFGYITIYRLREKKYLENTEEYFDKLLNFYPKPTYRIVDESKKRFKLNGLEVFSFRFEYLEREIKSVKLLKENLGFSIDFLGGHLNENKGLSTNEYYNIETFDQILSTFKFIDSTPSVENWKEKVSTCINSESFLYPNLPELQESGNTNLVELNIETCDTCRGCLTLPEDLYPRANRNITATGNTSLGYVSNWEEACSGTHVAPLDNNCTGDGYQAGGNGTVTFEAKSVVSGVPDINVNFTIK